MTTETDSWVTLAREIGPKLAAEADTHDREGTFVESAYRLFAERRIFSMGIPPTLGGGGASYASVCEFLRELATFDGSSALALSMHMHLVAAAVWKFVHGKPGEALLRKVAEGQSVLVSSGAGDWIDSNGALTSTAGGFRLNAGKIFGSGSPLGDILVGSARYEDPKEGAQVLHFELPLSSAGVSSAGDWDAHGMRGTGSHTVLLEDVFVPEEAITLRRPAGAWHPAWNVVLAVAPPIYMAPYVGIAEKAADLALASARSQASVTYVPLLAGELEVERTATRLAWRALVANVAEYDFAPSLERANAQLIHKALCARGARATVEKAMELAGGRAYYRSFGIERLLRDVRAAAFHPLPDKRQQEFSGRLALGRDVITGAAL